VKINKLAPEGVDMYVKCEYFNPLSSVKDRLALAVIEDAEKSGKLKPGMTVVEATSGNTGELLLSLLSSFLIGNFSLLGNPFEIFFLFFSSLQLKLNERAKMILLLLLLIIRHRGCNGVRAKRVPVRHLHGGTVFDRTP